MREKEKRTLKNEPTRLQSTTHATHANVLKLGPDLIGSPGDRTSYFFYSLLQCGKKETKKLWIRGFTPTKIPISPLRNRRVASRAVMFVEGLRSS